MASGLKMHTGIAAPRQPALGTRRLSSCSRLVAQVGAVTCSRRTARAAGLGRGCRPSASVSICMGHARAGARPPYRDPPCVPWRAVPVWAPSVRSGCGGDGRWHCLCVCVCVLGEPRAAGRQAWRVAGSIGAGAVSLPGGVRYRADALCVTGTGRACSASEMCTAPALQLCLV